MDKIFRDNKKAIAAIAGIGAAAALVTLVVKSVTKKGKAKEAITPEPIDIGSKGELSKLEKANIIAGIKVEYEGDILTVRTITQIIDAVVKFASPEFARLTKYDRDERRVNRDNLDRYIQLWDEFTQKLEEIVEKNQKDILKTLNVSENVWENSNSFYISQNNQELFMLQATLPQRLKTGLRATKKLTLAEFKEIIKAQIEATNQEATNINKISEKTKHAEEAAPILGNRVNDTIHAKFTVEEEDIFGALQLYVDDAEVQQLFRQLQAANMRLLPMPDFSNF